MTRRQERKGKFSTCPHCGAFMPRKRRKSEYVSDDSLSRTHRGCCQGRYSRPCVDCAKKGKLYSKSIHQNITWRTAKWDTYLRNKARMKNE